MNKMFLVMRHEFLRHLKRRSFLFAVLGLPTIMLVVIGGVILFFSSKATEPVGVVDQAHILMPPAQYAALQEDTVPFTLFSTESDARRALSEKNIQAYFVVSADYLQSGKVDLYHQGDVYDEIAGDVADYLRASLLQNSDPVILARFGDNDLDITAVSLARDERNISPLDFILPFIIGFIFLIAIFSSSGTLIQAIVDEKENRTMEILITSLKPAQLMIGKIVGLVGLGFIQIGTWLGLAFLGLAMARANISQFPSLTVAPSIILVAAGWFVPFYVLIAALITAIGISVTAASEGQQMVSIISIFSMFPLYFTGLILENPNSGLSVTLSLIPFSAPLTILTRSQITTVSTWQYILSWALLAGSAVLALFLVSRLLQFGLLRYGKKLSLREIYRGLRSG